MAAWRLVYDALRHRLGSGPTIAICIALYALPLTLSGSFVLIALALACGSVWTLERHLSGGLLAPLLTHLTWNALVMVLFPVVD